MRDSSLGPASAEAWGGYEYCSSSVSAQQSWDWNPFPQTHSPSTSPYPVLGIPQSSRVGEPYPPQGSLKRDLGCKKTLEPLARQQCLTETPKAQGAFFGENNLKPHGAVERVQIWGWADLNRNSAPPLAQLWVSTFSSVKWKH